ncbi:MAG: aminomethyl-transferring glycine dehydrogenase subunit GcvPA [Chloroflexota bacterium]|nr:MAG: aminomethyl-transferring glycine dehydrogenase subunit GcvPA [Chloroflexota bacterium]
MSYVPNTDADRAAMMEDIGISSVDQLFEDIPAQFRKPPLNLPPALWEGGVRQALQKLADRNVNLTRYACFLGAGAYRHFIPAVVGFVISRSEFYTAYTPYQAEISQGVLQSLFEYESMMADLTGMDIVNAGMYDGASAMAEAALMAVRITNRDKIAMDAGIHPAYLDVVRTYCQSQNVTIQLVSPPFDELESEYACLVVQQPSYYGFLEDMTLAERAAHNNGALLIVSVDPISLGMLKPPAAYNADIVVGEAQPLGIGISFGGPYLGLFACREKYLRQIPGRLIGQAFDTQGRRGAVMTLQTREQHVRRERSTSNICTSETLLAIAAAVYLAVVGKGGLRQVASLCYHKAHYAAARIAELPGYSLPFDRPFFKEFVVRCPHPPAELNRRLRSAHIIGGLDIGQYAHDCMLLCVTEMNSREEIDHLIDQLAKWSTP